MATILIAGCGYVGTALASRLAEEGHVVWGLRRDVRKLPAAIRPVEADLTQLSTIHLPSAIDVLVYAASADESSDAAYERTYVHGLRNILDALKAKGEHPGRLFFVSSTGVYEEQMGEWVDETTPLVPKHFTGKRLCEGEQLALASMYPATVVRFAGIYGPGRTRFIRMVQDGKATCDSEKIHYTNRIHRDDCAGVLRHLIAVKNPESLYLGVDCEPADEREVLRSIAKQLGIPEPKFIDGSPRPHRSNKRCKNARLLATGYRFKYPTFREGYGALIKQDPLFADNTIFTGDTPVDLAKNHDFYLYGDRKKKSS